MFLRVVGYLLLVFGLVWGAVIAGGVLSRAEGFTTLIGLLPGLAFHTVCMALGTWLAARELAGAQNRKAA